VINDEVYFRANFGAPDVFRACFVRASDGRVLYTHPQVAAYALRWEIATKESGQVEQVLVKHP
jgi:hypothetical protein